MRARYSVHTVWCDWQLFKVGLPEVYGNLTGTAIEFRGSRYQITAGEIMGEAVGMVPEFRVPVDKKAWPIRRTTALFHSV